MPISRRNLLLAAPAVALAGALAPKKSLAAGAEDAAQAAPGNILIVVANEIPHPKLGFPLGFWAAELTHPYAELVAHGYSITIASLQGGRVTIDPFSDPRHESGYSAHDFVSLGFLSSPQHVSLLDQTASIADLNPDDFQALVVAGGQAPMFTFRESEGLQNLIKTFYLSGRPTSALCHGVSALVDVQMDDGTYLVDGKTVTGFSAAEDAAVDEIIGVTLFDWWVEPALRERGANYMQNGMWANFAISDGNLITGQQQNSGGSVARLIIEHLTA